MELSQVRIISDIARNKGKILESMAKYGHFAEHNFLHYTYCESPGVKNVLLDCGKGRLILMQHDQRKNLWKLFPCGVLAPEDERTGLLLRAADIILKENLELGDSAELCTGFEGFIPTNAEALKEMKRHIRDRSVESVEKAFVMSALKRSNWNISRAAEETGMLRPNFQTMLKRLGISVKDYFGK